MEKQTDTMAAFDPQSETAADFDKRVCEFMARRATKSKKDSEALERRRRVLLVEFSPPQVKQLVCNALKPLDVTTSVPTEELLGLLDLAARQVSGSVEASGDMLGAVERVQHRLKLRRVHQGPEDSVADFVSSLDEVLSLCGYPKTHVEVVAKDRLIIGLRSFAMRSALVNLMDRPCGATYDEMRQAAIRMDQSQDRNRDQPSGRRSASQARQRLSPWAVDAISPTAPKPWAADPQAPQLVAPYYVLGNAQASAGCCGFVGQSWPVGLVHAGATNQAWPCNAYYATNMQRFLPPAIETVPAASQISQLRPARPPPALGLGLRECTGCGLVALATLGSCLRCGQPGQPSPS